jgi:hypothetical protein
MDDWNLEVELDGEWERCVFPSPEEADRTLQGLLSDYGTRLSRAKVISPEGRLVKMRTVKKSNLKPRAAFSS